MSNAPSSAMRRNAALEVEPVAGMVGAEIVNIDLSAPQPDSVWGEIRDALNRHGVVFFREQKISPQQQLDFTLRFGELFRSKDLPVLPECPQISVVRKEKTETVNLGGVWHTDQPHQPVPVMGTILLARETPAFGGDTLFTSMTAAYDALSEGLRNTLDGLRIIHSDAQIYKVSDVADVDTHYLTKGQRSEAEVSHPAVVRHPDTGRKALYLTARRSVRFDGWTREESAGLFGFLLQHVQKPEFTCRFCWREGSMAFWDNRLVMHYASNDYQGQRREMHRTMVAGTPLG